MTQFRPGRRSLAVAAVAALLVTGSILAQSLGLAHLLAAAITSQSPPSALFAWVVLVGIAFVVRGIALGFAEWRVTLAAAQATAAMQEATLEGLATTGPSLLQDDRVGEITIVATRGVHALESYFARYLPALVQAVVLPAAVWCFVVILDPWSGLLLAVLACAIPPSMAYFGRQAAAATTRQWQSLAALSARFFELIEGLTTLRVLRQEALGRAEVDGATERFGQSTRTVLRVAFKSSLALDLIAGLGVGLVAMELGLRLLSGRVNLVVALAVLLASPEFFAPLRRAGAEFHAAADGRAAALRLRNLIERAQPPAHDVAPLLELRECTARRGGTGEVGPISLVAQPGDKIVIDGPSGTGKTTVLQMLAGQLQPTSGLRCGPAHLAYVPQHPHCFAGTLRENLLVANPRASDRELLDALHASALDEVFADLAGLDTRLGPGGVELSAGELARLALSRAVASGCEVLLLDEPVAHLDAATLALVTARLAPRLAPATVILASHNPLALALFGDASVTKVQLPLPQVATP